MKGKLVLKISGNIIKVKGSLTNANIYDNAAVIDALMCSLGIKGEVRKSICEALVYVDAKRSEEVQQ